MPAPKDKNSVEYKEFCRRMKESWTDPIVRRKRVEGIKVGQNKLETKEKKSRAMLKLQQDPEFRRNFLEICKDPVRNDKIKQSQLGINNSYWKGMGYDLAHELAYELFGKEYCERCGMTNEEHIEKWEVRLHMHNKDGVPKHLTEDNWETLCRKCHPKTKEG